MSVGLPARHSFRIQVALSVAAICASVIAAYGMSDSQIRRIIVDTLSIVTAAFGATGAFIAAAKCQPQARLVRMWRLIGGAFVSWCVGSIAWMVIEVGLNIPAYPSIADLFFLGYFPLILAGMSSAPRARAGRAEALKISIEVAIAMVAGLLVFGNLLVVPFAAEKAASPLLTILSALYPAMDVALLWALVSLVLRRNPLQDTPTTLLLTSSIFFMIVADCLFTYRQLAGTYDTGELPDICYIASMCLGGLAGFRMAEAAHLVTPQMSAASAETQLLGCVDTRLLLWHRHVPNALVAFGLLALAWFPVMEFTPRISFLLGGSLIFVALVFLRQLLAIRENEELHLRLKETWEGLQQRTAELQQANLQLQIAFDEQKRIEEEQNAFKGKMQQMQKLESLGVLAGGIAHDFNNLLTGVIGNASLATEMLPPEHEVQPLLQDVERAATRAAGLTNQMLAYSGKGAFAISRIDLNGLASEMAILLHSSISKKVGLQMELKGQLPRIEGDPNQLTQVIMNLITNASEAIDPQSGTIIIRTGMMDVDHEFLTSAALPDPMPLGRYVFLEVCDDGQGMTAETISRIFEPFFTTKFTGRGLGLSATLGIIRGHKGNICVQSKPGVGTRFTLVFPPTGGVETKSEADPAVRLPSRNDQTILVVDDESFVRDIAVRVLRQRGFKAIEANHGREAIDAVKQHRNTIDAVLLDLMMPVMGGEEAFREIRRIDPALPVVLSSGFSEKAVSALFTGDIPTGFLHKPFTGQQLTEVLQLALLKRLETSEQPLRSDTVAGG